MTTFAADLYLLVAAYGLALATSYAGLPVLGQGAFVAVGAFGTAQLAGHGVPLLLAAAASVAMAAAAGYVVGFGASRLSGAPLALATWALAWLVYVVLLRFPAVSGGSDGLTRPAPARLTSPSLGVEVVLTPWVHAVVGLVLAGGAAAALARAARGPWGLDWAALRTGPALADSLGVPVQRRRRALLATTAALGALGGAGTGVLLGVVAPVDYSPLLSLQLFVAVLVGGTATWWGPPIGIALLAALPDAADGIADLAGIDPLRARAVLTAVFLVAVLALRRPVGARLGPVLARWPSPPRWRPRRRPVQPHAQVAAPPPLPPAGDVLVQLREVSVRYGAVVALDRLDLDLRAGEVHALVGPNGSGKSTALRVAAGVLSPAAGSVAVSGRVHRARSAADRVRAGVVRTLQRTAMLGELPVRRQVEVGTRARETAGFAGLRDLLGTPSARAAAAARAGATARALAATGLAERADARPNALDTAAQRRVQVARALGTGATALLVDEPAAGMSRPERDELAGLLRGLADAGHGVLLVEHDMGLVGRVADRVTVLAEGRVLATGAPAAIRADPRVRAAYLGGAD